MTVIIVRYEDNAGFMALGDPWVVEGRKLREVLHTRLTRFTTPDIRVP